MAKRIKFGDVPSYTVGDYVKIKGNPKLGVGQIEAIVSDYEDERYRVKCDVWVIEEVEIVDLKPASKKEVEFYLEEKERHKQGHFVSLVFNYLLQYADYVPDDFEPNAQPEFRRLAWHGTRRMEQSQAGVLLMQGITPDSLTEDQLVYPEQTDLERTRADPNLVGAGICLHDIDQNLVLFVSRKSTEDDWGIPAGGFEGTESVLECALRELRAETNIVVPSRLVDPTRAFTARCEGTKELCTFYVGFTEIDRDPFCDVPSQKTENGRTFLIRWFSPWVALDTTNSFRDYNCDMLQYFGILP